MLVQTINKLYALLNTIHYLLTLLGIEILIKFNLRRISHLYSEVVR